MHRGLTLLTTPAADSPARADMVCGSPARNFALATGRRNRDIDAQSACGGKLGSGQPLRLNETGGADRPGHEAAMEAGLSGDGR
jgi:hypothetical protein